MGMGRGKCPSAMQAQQQPQLTVWGALELEKLFRAVLGWALIGEPWIRQLSAAEAPPVGWAPPAFPRTGAERPLQKENPDCA